MPDAPPQQDNGTTTAPQQDAARKPVESAAPQEQAPSRKGALKGQLAGLPYDRQLQALAPDGGGRAQRPGTGSAPGQRSGDGSRGGAAGDRNKLALQAGIVAAQLHSSLRQGVDALLGRRTGLDVAAYRTSLQVITASLRDALKDVASASGVRDADARRARTSAAAQKVQQAEAGIPKVLEHFSAALRKGAEGGTVRNARLSRPIKHLQEAAARLRGAAGSVDHAMNLRFCIVGGMRGLAEMHRALIEDNLGEGTYKKLHASRQGAERSANALMAMPAGTRLKRHRAVLHPTQVPRSVPDDAARRMRGGLAVELVQTTAPNGRRVELYHVRPDGLRKVGAMEPDRAGDAATLGKLVQQFLATRPFLPTGNLILEGAKPQRFAYENQKVLDSMALMFSSPGGKKLAGVVDLMSKAAWVVTVLGVGISALGPKGAVVGRVLQAAGRGASAVLAAASVPMAMVNLYGQVRQGAPVSAQAVLDAMGIGSALIGAGAGGPAKLLKIRKMLGRVRPAATLLPGVARGSAALARFSSALAVPGDAMSLVMLAPDALKLLRIYSSKEYRSAADFYKFGFDLSNLVLSGAITFLSLRDVAKDAKDAKGALDANNAENAKDTKNPQPREGGAQEGSSKDSGPKQETKTNPAATNVRLGRVKAAGPGAGPQGTPQNGPQAGKKDKPGGGSGKNDGTTGSGDGRSKNNKNPPPAARRAAPAELGTARAGNKSGAAGASSQDQARAQAYRASCELLGTKLGVFAGLVHSRLVRSVLVPRAGEPEGRGGGSVLVLDARSKPRGVDAESLRGALNGTLAGLAELRSLFEPQPTWDLSDSQAPTKLGLLLLQRTSAAARAKGIAARLATLGSQPGGVPDAHQLRIDVARFDPAGAATGVFGHAGAPVQYSRKALESRLGGQSPQAADDRARKTSALLKGGRIEEGLRYYYTHGDAVVQEEYRRIGLQYWHEVAAMPAPPKANVVTALPSVMTLMRYFAGDVRQRAMNGAEERAYEAVCASADAVQVFRRVWALHAHGLTLAQHALRNKQIIVSRLRARWARLSGEYATASRG